MKFYGFVIIQIITVSCSGGTQHESQSTQVEKPWEQKIVTTEIHTYNQLGILDSTYKTETYFISGVQSSTTNFLVARTYSEGNNLLRERTFQLFKTGTQLSEEKVFKYDLKNNLIETIEKFQNVINEKDIFQYNSNNQKTQETKIQKRVQITPKGWTMDSIRAHQNDKIKLLYDTLLTLYTYDTVGRLTKKVLTNSKGEHTETVITSFSGPKKILTVGLNSKGDTISTTHYKIKGSLTEEVTESKQNLYTKTVIYSGDKEVETILISGQFNSRSRVTYMYDAKGNLIEKISYI